MTTSVQQSPQPSAKIYQFPRTRIRSFAGSDHDGIQLSRDGHPDATVPIVYGSAWYHEEAIREASQSHDA